MDYHHAYETYDDEPTRRHPMFPHTPKRAPSAGFGQTKKHRSTDDVPVPWEFYIAESFTERNTECLLCGRISARNPWRTRAHFMGGDAHVQVCPQLTGELVDYIETHCLNQDYRVRRNNDKATTVLLSPPSCSTLPTSPQLLTMPYLDLGPASTTTMLPITSPHHMRCAPNEGFELDTNPEAQNTWRINVAFNKEKGKAQCLLCNRVSKNNAARLKAHFWGGDKHVAICPFVSRDHMTSLDLNGGSSSPMKRARSNSTPSSKTSTPTTNKTFTPTTSSKRERLESSEEGFLCWLLAAADVVESNHYLHMQSADFANNNPASAQSGPALLQKM